MTTYDTTDTVIVCLTVIAVLGVITVVAAALERIPIVRRVLSALLTGGQ